MSGTKSATFPMVTNLKLCRNDSSLLPNSTSYRSLIGKLIYLTVTRPYLSFAIQVLSQFMAAPFVNHVNVA